MGSEHAAVYTGQEMMELALHVWVSVGGRWQQSVTEEDTLNCQKLPCETERNRKPVVLNDT